MLKEHNYVKERSELSCHLLCLLRIYVIQPRFQILHTRNRSLFYYQNGYSDLVVMSSELYDKFARINRIDQAIFESEQEIANGAEAVDAEIVFAELEKKH